MGPELRGKLIRFMFLLCGPFIIYFLWPSGSFPAYLIISWLGIIVISTIYILVALIKIRLKKTNNQDSQGE